MHPVLCPWLSQTRLQYFLVRDNLLPSVFFVKLWRATTLIHKTKLDHKKRIEQKLKQLLIMIEVDYSHQI